MSRKFRRSDDDVQTLMDVLSDFWQARRFILIGGGMGVLLAAAFLLFSTPYYKARMVVSPANPMNGAEMSSLMVDDSLFALRHLVQRMGAANSSDFVRFENTYGGPSVAALLLKDEKVRRGLSLEKRFGFLSSPKITSAEELAAYISKHVRFESVGATSLRRMVYWHPDRAFGVYFLRRIHQVGDALIRQKIRQDTTQRVRYLGRAVEETNNPDHKRALTALLLEQERLKMLVSIDMPYAAAVIEPPSSPVQPGWPNAFLIVPVFMFVGAVLGFVVYGIFIARAQTGAHQFEFPAMDTGRWFMGRGSNTNEKPFSSSHAAE